MLSRISIRARLTIAFAVALLVVLVLAGLFVYQRLDHELTESLDNGLASRADDLAALVASAGDSPPQLSGGRFVESDEVFSQILTPEGGVVASTLAPSAGPALEPQEIEAATEETVIAERDVPGIEHGARVLGRPASSVDGTVVVVAGASTEDRVEALDGLDNAFLVGAPLALVLASGIGYLLATRSLKPVDAMRRRAQEITLERSGERLPLPRTEDEIHQLGATLNTMLDRIEASLERERVFVADASHELRTPLSILKTELELADRRGRTPEELRGALHSAREEVDRLSRLAEDLLVIARSDQGRLPIKRETVETSQVLARVRDRFSRRAAEQGREIVVDAPAGETAELDPFLIEQALGNLVDNALRHGDGEVRLSGRRRDGSVVLEVSDEGPGFPAGFEAEAFERFTRPDGARTGGGAGLGLAIVRAVATAHGGRAAVSGGAEGAPTTLRITLPLRAPG
jgi:two-component system, OmpR family, sensor kinase